MKPKRKRNQRKRLIKSVDSATEIILESRDNPEETGVVSETVLNSSSSPTTEDRWKFRAGCSVNQIRQSRRKIEMDVQRLHSRVHLLLFEEQKAQKIIDTTRNKVKSMLEAAQTFSQEPKSSRATSKNCFISKKRASEQTPIF